MGWRASQCSPQIWLSRRPSPATIAPSTCNRADRGQFNQVISESGAKFDQCHRDAWPGSGRITTMAFDQSGLRWLGISDLIAEPEGPTFISYKVARSRLNRLRFLTPDPNQTSRPKLFAIFPRTSISIQTITTLMFARGWQHARR
jgi:hypothetical protein